MNWSLFVKGDKIHCATECAKSDLCKSFDLCKKPNSESYCHLKDLDWDDYRKDIATGEKNQSYFGCKHPKNMRLID